MEQTGSRLIRNAGSWYEHGYIYDGYTNKGEVLGSSIGPGSNSHYFSFNRIRNKELIGVGLKLLIMIMIFIMMHLHQQRL